MNTRALQYAHLDDFEPSPDVRAAFQDVVDALAAITDGLNRAPKTPESRAWLVEAHVYARTVRNWDILPPSPRQVAAMRECLTELLAKIWLDG
ncbi:MAG TPA: hypothetical protein PLR99_05125 [Polyangiaceae bacterium]|nr:hypothetical protein [Polyangiaceae bacterium]